MMARIEGNRPRIQSRIEMPNECVRVRNHEEQDFGSAQFAADRARIETLIRSPIEAPIGSTIRRSNWKFACELPIEAPIDTAADGPWFARIPLCSATNGQTEGFQP